MNLASIDKGGITVASQNSGRTCKMEVGGKAC